MPRLTPTEWDSASQMWASGDFTLDEIAERYDITPAALHRRFQKAGVEKGQAKETLQKAMQQSIESKANQKAAELIEMASQVKELHIKGAQMLSKRLMYEIKKATEDGRSLAMIRDDIRSIQDASKTLQTNYQTVERILHLDREETPDDEIPELVVRRMTNEDVAELRDQQSREIEEMTAGFGDDVDPDNLLAEDSDLTDED